MGNRIGKALVFVVVALVFIPTIMQSFSGLSGPITRDDAIEVSRNSELVKKSLTDWQLINIETNFYNSSDVEWMKKSHPNGPWEKIADGHNAWEVIWWFRYPPCGSRNVIVIVDADTGVLSYDERGAIFI